MGHVNNAVYATYLEFARFDWSRKCLGVKSLEDFPFILARVEIDYRQPITVQSQPIVALWVTDIGSSSWTFGYRISDAADPGTTYADARSVQVAYNYHTGQKEILSTELRQVLEQEMQE